MAVDLRMPSLGMAMDEGRLSAWLVKEGDHVERGQVVAEIESEKVAYEIEAPATGTVGPILVAVDDVVPVGTTLVVIDDGAGSQSAPAQPAEPAARAAVEAGASAAAGGAPAGARQGRLSPRARRLAESLGVDIAALRGSGADGMIVEEDIRQAALQQSSMPAARDAGARFVLRPLTLMRRTIAERMTASAREAPHFSLALDVDGSALLRYRSAQSPRLEAQTGIKLTVTDLLAWLTAQTLRSRPALNAAYSPDGVREWIDVNLGLAVAVDDGLVVPVLRRADTRALADLVRARADLVTRARAGKLRAEDVADGTFTLSNLGGFGIDSFTSILNPGQAGILSIGALRERPAVANGQLVARPTMTIALTIDHRVADGAGGARFLGELKNRIERIGLEQELHADHVQEGVM